MLMTPGPVKLVDSVRIAQSKDMISHRAKGFEEVYWDVCERMKKGLDSEEAHVLTGSGTLGVETILSNACNKGDKILCLNNGEFGKRFADIARVYYSTVQEEKIEQGKGWNLERAKAAIDNSNAQVLGMVYNDTAVGVTNKASEICNYAKKKGMITVVDGVSAWPAMELSLRNFGIDFFATGSQKAIAAPPGLAMVGISKNAVDLVEKKPAPLNYYMDLKKCRKFMLKRQTPYTPAVSLFYGLQAALDYMDARGGIPANIERHAKAAAYSRAWVGKNGFKVVAEPGFESNTITGFWTDKCDDIKKRLVSEYNIETAGGMGELKGKILRICHIGNFTQQELDTLLLAMEKIVKG